MGFHFRKKTHEAIDAEAIKAEVVDKLKTIFDPEIPVNIYDLGLIYDIAVHLIDKHEMDKKEKANIVIQMTLTTPNCPVAQTFPQTVEQNVMLIDAVDECTVELVWEPAWTRDRMSEAARLELGMF